MRFLIIILLLLSLNVKAQNPIQYYWMNIWTFNECGYTFDPDARLFLEHLERYSPLTCVQKLAVDTLVRDLKGEVNPRYTTHNVWDSLLAIYPIVGGVATNHSFNLKNPRTYRMTWVNSPTHSSTGVDWNGSSQYGNTNLIPSTSSFITINSMHMSYYSRETNNNNEREMGGYVTATNITRLIIHTAGSTFAEVNNSGAASGTAPATKSGLFVTSRILSTQYQVYRNGTSYLTRVQNSNGLGNGTIVIGAQGNGSSSITIEGYTTKECAFASIGKGLTSTQNTGLWNAVQAYQQRLGRHVGTGIF